MWYLRPTDVNREICVDDGCNGDIAKDTVLRVLHLFANAERSMNHYRQLPIATISEVSGLKAHLMRLCKIENTFQAKQKDLSGPALSVFPCFLSFGCADLHRWSSLMSALVRLQLTKEMTTALTLNKT